MASSADIPTAKYNLRASLREAPDGDSAAVAAAVAEYLAARPGLSTIASYAALPGEVHLLHLVAAHPDRHWVFPRIDRDCLTFHLVRSPGEDLVQGTFAIREPKSSLNLVPVSEIDAFLCPGLAFDRAGGRLGRGKGFYDRMLATARPGAVKIGVTFANRIFDHVPREPHDVMMDAVIAA
ncbi:MAG: 5-formyltetrahydrofolate cyclo-ligase [Verrucomicrobiota bacterium]